MKILVTPTSFLSEENKEARTKLDGFADEVIYNDLGRPLAEDELAERLKGVDGYLAGLDYITAKALEQADSLKVISRYGAGIDRVDLNSAKEKNIVVTNTPGTNSTAVAEMAMGMIFCAARNIPNLHNGVKEGQWIRAKGTQLLGKTLGVIGFGAIGQELARCASGIGMKVVAFDPFFNEKVAERLGVKPMSFDEVLKNADFISLHLPLNDKTKHIINKEKIKIMKDGAVLVNTSRGGIIEEQDAADALKSGKLGFICLDVFEVEPPTDSPLMQVKNSVLTPHAGAHTSEAVSGMGIMAVDNLIAVMQGKECNNIIRA